MNSGLKIRSQDGGTMAIKDLNSSMRKRFKEGANVRKLTVTVFLINVLQLVFVLGLLVNSVLHTLHGPSLFLGIAGGLGALVSMQGALALMRSYNHAVSAEQAIVDLESLNRTMRAQRHDYMNHIQVVGALLDLEEYSEAKNYLAKVSTDMQSISRALKTSHPAINALLQAKLLKCEKHGILLEIDIASRLERLPIPSWELCRILGNLIDNAIEAIDSEKPSIPRIKVLIADTECATLVRVSNNGPLIPEAIQQDIFLPDFSTKGEERGMGLAIISDIIYQCGGTIRLRAEPETQFEILLPADIEECKQLEEPH